MSEYADVLQKQIDHQENQYNNFFIEITNYSIQLIQGINALDKEIDNLEKDSVEYRELASARDAIYLIADGLATILKRNV